MSDRQDMINKAIDLRIDLTQKLVDAGVTRSEAAYIVHEAFWAGWECGYEARREGVKS